ncbi:hypothetical protein HYS93_05095 [Candidatus Daviesbacteria bacterium]|nr:hypothetical protein [Candidatus Daviesbacteria bacterium]
MVNNQFNCPACGVQFKSKQELDKHAQEMHGSKAEEQQEHSISCSKCGLKANSKVEIEEHEQHHSM